MTAPLAVNHTSLFPSVTVSFNLAAGVSLSQATARIDSVKARLGAPTTLHTFFSGTLLAFRQSLAREPLLIVTALLAVYIVLGILYESLVHPLTIISTLPSASVWAMLALLLFHQDLNIISLIAIILLIGIVKKNGIMMVDFALDAERTSHASPRYAVMQACLLRFRPILMTTMAAIFGAAPLALGSGMGAELRRPLGITIIGGLVASQLLTLYTTPVVYLLLDRARMAVRRLGMRRSARGKYACLLAACAAACNLGPRYVRPSAPTPAAFKEMTGPEDTLPPGTWRPATPREGELKGKWWELFDEPELDALEERVDTANQSIAAAFEQLMAARALVRQAQAGYYPTVTFTPSYQYATAGSTAAGVFATSSGTMSTATTTTTAATAHGTSTINTFSLPLEASWAPDLWGRVRNAVAQNRFAAQVSAADLENTKLTAHATLAESYFQLRGQDALQELYDRTIVADRRTLEITRGLAQTGVGDQEAVAQAAVTLANFEATATNLAINRTLYEHAIATLVGQPPAQFSLPARPLTTKVPSIPVLVPSLLLERRPDVAAAERAMAQANAAIGVARAAYFPTLNLTPTGGLESSSLATLISVPALFFSLGVSASELVFDGGLRSATERQYLALYRASVAAYRQTVLTALQQVEDYLATLRIVSQQIGRQTAAVDAARQHLELAVGRYTTGIDPYLNVISAQTTLLADEQTLVSLRVTHLTAAVQLVEALGGGWQGLGRAP